MFHLLLYFGLIHFINVITSECDWITIFLESPIIVRPMFFSFLGRLLSICNQLIEILLRKSHGIFERTEGCIAWFGTKAIFSLYIIVIAQLILFTAWRLISHDVYFFKLVFGVLSLPGTFLKRMLECIDPLEEQIEQGLVVAVGNTFRLTIFGFFNNHLLQFDWGLVMQILLNLRNLNLLLI